MFDPKKVLRQLSIPLLREFFRRRGELQDLPWASLKDSRNFDPIYEACQRLPEQSRQQVYVKLREVHQLADEKGIKAICQALLESHTDRLCEFDSCKTRPKRAMWFCLHFPELFEQVSLFAQTDSLEGGRYYVRRNNGLGSAEAAGRGGTV